MWISYFGEFRSEGGSTGVGEFATNKGEVQAKVEEKCHKVDSLCGGMSETSSAGKAILEALHPVLRQLKSEQRGGSPSRNKARAVALLQQATVEVGLAYPGEVSDATEVKVPEVKAKSVDNASAAVVASAPPEGSGGSDGKKSARGKASS